MFGPWKTEAVEGVFRWAAVAVMPLSGVDKILITDSALEIVFGPIVKL